MEQIIQRWASGISGCWMSQFSPIMNRHSTWAIPSRKLSLMDETCWGVTFGLPWIPSLIPSFTFCCFFIEPLGKSRSPQCTWCGADFKAPGQVYPKNGGQSSLAQPFTSHWIWASPLLFNLPERSARKPFMATWTKHDEQFGFRASFRAYPPVHGNGKSTSTFKSPGTFPCHLATIQYSNHPSLGKSQNWSIQKRYTPDPTTKILRNSSNIQALGAQQSCKTRRALTLAHLGRAEIYWCPQYGELKPIDLDVECCKHGFLWEDRPLMSFDILWVHDGQCICYSKSIHPLPSDAIGFFSVELGEYPQQDQQDAYVFDQQMLVLVHKSDWKGWYVIN